MRQRSGAVLAVSRPLVCRHRVGGGALKQYAVELGLDAEGFNTCLDSQNTARKCRKTLTMRALPGVNATPSFFVNGLPINGAVPFERFVELVELALERANGQ